jgi:predicted membrane channel-forming protein YqfA (hemolysin III family)
MGEETKPKASSNRNMHAMILAVLGVIVLIAGVAIATVKGTHLRGSGLGTLAIVIGVVLLLIGALRFYYKRP